MGIYDRDYIRQPASRSLGGLQWSVNTWLIVINVAVFVLDALIQQTVVDPDGFQYQVHPLSIWGYFSISKAVWGLELWRFFTFQFLHANATHLVVNMIGLFFFGQMIEGIFGSRRYLVFYLLCGMAGPVMYILLWAAGVLHGADSAMVGASAGIFGVLIAAAMIAPDTIVNVWGVLPIRMRALAWILLGVAIFTIFTSGHNAGGEAAHLGGAAAGFVLVKNPAILDIFAFRRRPRMRYRP